MYVLKIVTKMSLNALFKKIWLAYHKGVRILCDKTFPYIQLIFKQFLNFNLHCTKNELIY